MATEKRLIRYDGLKQEIIDFKKGLNPRNTDYAIGYFSALSVVEGMMVQHIAEETVEVVRGRWINPYMNHYGHPCHCCSVCGFKASYQDKNYCPNCGADMRERKDNVL